MSSKIFVLKIPSVCAKNILFGKGSGSYLINMIAYMPSMRGKKVYICSSDSNNILGYCVVDNQGNRQLSKIISVGKEIDADDIIIQRNHGYYNIKSLSSYNGVIPSTSYPVTRLVNATPFSHLLSYDNIKSLVSEAASKIDNENNLIVFEDSDDFETLIKMWESKFSLGKYPNDDISRKKDIVR